jgi:chromosome segregation ATPase
VLATQLAAA